SPSPYSYFSGVAAVASNDVWAVGAWQSRPGFPWSAMIEHWDGASWTRTPIPDLPGGTVLASVSRAAPDDVWAVGTMDPDYPLTMHWDGSSADSPGPSSRRPTRRPMRRGRPRPVPCPR